MVNALFSSYLIYYKILIFIQSRVLISFSIFVLCEEPTSGLDSYQAYQVVKTLRKLADNGKTIIAVIHQPSQQVFSTFDDLLLLSDGRQMYFGEV